jgi:tetratricopeptide (TPR) repeat protein
VFIFFLFFFAVFLICPVFLFLFMFFSGSSGEKKQALKLRDSVQSNEEFLKSEAEVTRIKDDPNFKARDSIQFQKAEEHFTRGFRDYRNGQYGRAIEGFQAALSFFPSHELARRYYTQSVRKFDQMVQMHMVRGRQYYGKKNYQRCMSEFRAVVIMRKDPRDTVRKEALQLYEECQLRLEEGR